MARPPPPKSFSRDDALGRLVRGQEAGVYTELIDIDEVEGLNDAYLAIQDTRFPPRQPPKPLTSDEFKHYVRLVYNAIRSIDAARDAYAKDKDGKVTGKTFAKEYLDSIGMFEMQLVSGKLVKAVHRAQAGIITLPVWTQIPGVSYSRYDTFAGRIDHVIEALRVWKLFGCALFMDHETIMEKRLAMQPEKEMLTERCFSEDTEDSDISPLLRLQYARSILPDPDPTPDPKPDEPAAATKNDEGDKHADKTADEHEDANTPGTPALAGKKRKHRNSDTALDDPGERHHNTRSAKKKSVAPAAAALANASTSAKAGPSTAVSSNVASGSVQPATPAGRTASSTARLTRSASAAGAVSTPSSRLRPVQPADASVGSPNTGTTSGLRSARRRTTQQEVSSDLPASTDRCDAKFFPSQPSHQQDQPPPDYQASQRATCGFQQSGRLANGLPSAKDNSGALEAQWAAAKALGPYQTPENRDVTATNNHNISFKNGKAFNSSHAPVTDMRQTHNGSSVVVNNFFQPRTASLPGGQAFASPQDGNERRVDYYFGTDGSQTREHNEAALQRDSPLPPRAPPNTPQEVRTTGRHVQEQYQVYESLLPFGRLTEHSYSPSNYALPPTSAPPAVFARNSTVAGRGVPPPSRSGWSLNLAGEDPTDAMGIQNCRRVGYGLPPVHTTGWRQQKGAPAAARDTSAAGHSAAAPRSGSSLDMEEYTLEEQKALADWHRIQMGLYPVHTTGWRFQEEEPDTPYAWTGPPEGTDGFVPFREAPEEYEYDFKEEARNEAKKIEAGDKRKRQDVHEDGTQAARPAAAPRTLTKPYTAKITRVVSTRPRNQAQNEAGDQGNRESRAAHAARTARVLARSYRLTEEILRQSGSQADNEAGDKGEPEDGEDGSEETRPVPAPRTPTKRYRINPRLGRETGSPPF